MADPTPILGTNLASAIVPFTTADQFPTHLALYGKGGWRSVDTTADRDAISEMRLEEGMVVYVIETQTPYIYTDSTWLPFQTGGGSGGKQPFIRFNYTKNIAALPPSSSSSFELPFGKTSMILQLTVSRPVKVTVWSTPDHTETNPYTFLATANHLTDDGSALLSDGTILKQRNYSIFANLESPPQEKVYAVVESVDAIDGPVTLDITYIVIETELGDTGVPYSIPVDFITTPTTNQTLLLRTFVETVTFAQNFDGSAGAVETNPTANFIMSVYKNADVVGTITVAIDGTFAFVSADDVIYTNGDTLKIVAPTDVDATIANLSMSLLGTKN